MSFHILGLGTAVPDTILTQEDGILVNRKLCKSTAEQATWLPNLYKGTGIQKRHMVLEKQLVRDLLDDTRHSHSAFLPKLGDERTGPTTAERMGYYARFAGPLALEAARRALEQARVAPRQVTQLVTVSCTGFRAPGVDIELIKGLGLPCTTERTNVGFMGCHGALNGLRVARGLALADPRACVLLCAVELCTLHYNYGWEAQKVIANAIFADGAAAIVGAASGPDDGWRLAASGSCVFPKSEDAMTWTVGDQGFDMTLSKQVPDLIGANLRPWVDSWLDRQGLAVGQVASWAIHPGGPKILSAAEEALGLAPEASRAAHEVFAANGNMSSPTILFLLDYLRSRRAPRPCVALGFGPGLTVEAALFR